MTLRIIRETLMPDPQAIITKDDICPHFLCFIFRICLLLPCLSSFNNLQFIVYFYYFNML